jgi:hypothetical protein
MSLMATITGAADSTFLNATIPDVADKRRTTASLPNQNGGTGAAGILAPLPAEAFLAAFSCSGRNGTL